jgi:hypothetical protein
MNADIRHTKAEICKRLFLKNFGILSPALKRFNNRSKKAPLGQMFPHQYLFFKNPKTIIAMSIGNIIKPSFGK